MTRDGLLLFLSGLLIGVLAVGWAQEARMLVQERAMTATWLQRVGLQTAVMDEAVRLAQQDPVERAGAVAQATTNVLRRKKP